MNPTLSTTRSPPRAPLPNTIQELRPMLRLAVPLAFGELGWMSMSLVDSIMVGRLPQSALAIGAVSLGQGLFYTVSIFGGGLLLGLDTLISQAHGRKDQKHANHSLLQALYIGMCLLPLLMLSVWNGPRLLALFGVDTRLIDQTKQFLYALTWSLPPLLLYFALRRYLQALNHVRPVMFALITANLINVAGNWILIYGHWGMPALGVAGSGWSTCIARLYMAGVLVAALLYFNHRDKLEIHKTSISFDPARIRQLLGLGLPAATQILLEIAIFSVVSLLAGKLGVLQLAAHQVALNCAAFSFMVPLGVSSAAAVRVGQAYGRKDFPAAQSAARAAILVGCSFMGLAGLFFITMPRLLARIFSPDPAVIEISAQLLFIAAAFQLFDGMQVVVTGILRGIGNTRLPMFASLIGYWVLGLPISIFFGFRLGWGVQGLWIGLCVGLILVAIALYIAWERTILKHSVSRL